MKHLFLIAFVAIFVPSKGISQSLTVKQLYDQYRQNELNFQNKYQNKQVTLTGKIYGISVGSSYFKDEHRVRLTATGYETFVTCRLPYADSAALRSLKVGEVITVKGTISPVMGGSVMLTDCSFAAAKAAIPQKRSTPPNAPLGKYNTYQNDGAGFSFQYTMYLRSYTAYSLNQQTGTCNYNAATKVIHFLSGPLKGFAGVYRPFSDNEQDPPAIILDSTGKVPDVKNLVAKGYQYAYYQSTGK